MFGKSVSRCQTIAGAHGDRLDRHFKSRRIGSGKTCACSCGAALDPEISITYCEHLRHIASISESRVLGQVQLYRCRTDVVKPAKPAIERVVDGLALGIEHARFEGDENAGLHERPSMAGVNVPPYGEGTEAGQALPILYQPSTS